MDAGFADGKLFKGLEEMGCADYIVRLRCNAALDKLAGEHLRQPPGTRLWNNKPRTWCHELEYKANPWEGKRRVVLCVVERPGLRGTLGR